MCPPPANRTAGDAATLAHTVRLCIIEQSKRAHVGHIGSALSIVDLLAALYAGPLTSWDARDHDRDRFVLSKGHAALALYCVLYATGRLSAEQLETFCVNGSELLVHPEARLDGVDFATGSLGQGVSMAVGAALAARIQHSSRRVFAIMSDAECDEGSVWEAALFAAHHRLSNLTVLIDANGQQALGYTKDALGLEPLAQKWSSFGWNVDEVNGHDREDLARAVSSVSSSGDGPPHVVVARTVFGRGVSFMERRLEWHYLPLSDSEYQRALVELEGRPRHET